jgi:hypothetical protein
MYTRKWQEKTLTFTLGKKESIKNVQNNKNENDAGSV